MKRLTISRISAASIRANRKTYMSLAAGILLAVFLATAVTLGAYGIIAAMEREVVQKIGYTDCVLYDEPDVTDETLRNSGLFDEIGKVYVTASVKDSAVWLGYMDEAGDAMLARSCTEGRLPEAPGEIAVEQSALEKLRSEAGVGDTVTWTLTPVDGVEEERTFTIVGLLREQSGNMDMSDTYWSSGGLFCWPSVLVSADEPGFAAGRTVIHRVMTYAPLTTYSRAQNYHSLVDAHLFPASRAEGRILGYTNPDGYDTARYLEQTSFLWVLGLSLLLAVSIGISSAMESVLAAKTEEIGMLRAVGATRRQIRRIFGRDAWLLSLVALPVGLALGVFAAWVLCRLSPENMVFSVKAWLLLPVLGISALCVFVSSALPLRRASRQMPMGVLRDTALLRKAGRFRSKTQFRATELIAGRQLRVHPWRQLGAALMVMATLLCASFVGEMSYDAVSELAKGHPIAFSLYTDTAAFPYYDFAVTKPKSILTAQDIAQIRGLPEVERADVSAETTVDMLFDGKLPTYFDAQDQPRYQAYDESGRVVYHIFSELNGFGYLDIEEGDPEPPKPSESDAAGRQRYDTYRLYEQMKAAMDAQSLSGKPVPFTLYVADLEDVDWTDRVAEGKVDLAAIDAGEQVLVYAPTIYIYQLDSGGYMASTLEGFTKDGPVDELHNDYFYAGQSLSLTQLLNDVPNDTPDDYDGWRADYARMERHDAAVTVGAVLDGKPIVDGEVSFITTEQGAAALGFDITQIRSVGISLTGDVDEETEQMLQSRLERIAMRGDLQLYNVLQSWREELASMKRAMLLFAGMLLLFFAVAVSMQVGNAGRRIRSDSRMIGTLRAVGADEKALLGCYRLPMILTTLVGSMLAVALYVAFVLWYHSVVHEWLHPWTVAPAMLALGALCAVSCLAGVRARLKTVLSRSIMENIREL